MTDLELLNRYLIHIAHLNYDINQKLKLLQLHIDGVKDTIKLYSTLNGEVQVTYKPE